MSVPLGHLCFSRSPSHVQELGVFFPFFSVFAAAAASLQLCPTRCDPMDGSPPGSPVPRILQARTLEWGAIAFPFSVFTSGLFESFIAFSLY